MASYKSLSDEVLLSAYQKAIELELEVQFIEFLNQELIRRGLIANPDFIGGDSCDSKE